MTGMVESLFALAIVGSMAYFRLERALWTFALLAALIFYTFFSTFSGLTLLGLWALFLAVAVLFNHEPFRLRFITLPVLAFFKSKLPPMSETERIAMEAGDVWWDGELFSGRPDWQALLRFSKPRLTEEEEAFIQNEVEDLCAIADDWTFYQQGDLSKEAWSMVRSKGFWGLVIPKTYGGKGFSPLAHSTIVAKIASRSTSLAVTVMVPNSLGPAELLLMYGTPEQRDYYLPRLASGLEVPCFALTGVHAGSDASSISDLGIVCEGVYQNKKVLGIRLSWEKRYITLAPIASVLGLAFKLSDPEHFLGDKTDLGITLALIPAQHPGVELGARHQPMGLPFMNGPTSGKDVFIPFDFIIGGMSQIGNGWRMLMEALSVGRGISLPALSAATGQLFYRTTGAYAKIRTQFKAPIGHFEGVQEALARIGGYTYLLESARVLTAHACSQGIKPSVVSAIAKYHMTELNRKIMNDAMDIHAGRAVQFGPHNYLGLHYMAIPISITVEGANILTRNLIIFGQGAMRCHPYLKQEIEAAHQPGGLGLFDELLQSHIGSTLSHCVRGVFYGLTNAFFIKKPVKNAFSRYYQQLTRMSTALAFSTEMAFLFLGGDLKRRESLSARLGDVLSHLYLASSALKYYHDQGSKAEDALSLQWGLDHCLAEIQIAFDEFFANFPNRIIASVLKRMIFPYGRVYLRSPLRLSHALAKQMMTLSEFRQRLTQYCYIGDHKKPVGIMEVALQKVIAAELAEKKLKSAISAGQLIQKTCPLLQIDEALSQKCINEFEAQALKEAYFASEEAIKVDDFDLKKTLSLNDGLVG